MTIGRISSAFVATALLLAVLAVPGRTQQHGTTTPGIPPPNTGRQSPFSDDPSKDPDPGRVALQERQVRARNDDRQKRLVADTDKLLTLATQLHDDVAKTDKNILSLDVVRRADEIEKLAHSVKERMKG